MHYTSVENIHKVIDPLFLDELRAEFSNIMNDNETRYNKRGREKLSAFLDKLASLKFLDPACGSGNFLTESYICLRRLENEVILHLGGGSSDLFSGIEGAAPVKVNLNQFYGIEINDFAATVAKTALWIAESQLLQETEQIVGHSIDFLPLKTYSNIVEGNALRMDWNNVVPCTELDYIMGNPPFVGSSLQSKEQKEDILSIFVDKKGKTHKTAGKLDYVSGWYLKSAQFIDKTSIRVAFVSTNSITQGEQVAFLWKPLVELYHIHIDFAWQTFIWDSEASEKANVYCVIIGFSSIENNNKKQIITRKNEKILSDNINFYLLPEKNVFIESRKDPLCEVPDICKGFQATDNGFLILSQTERDDMVKSDPKTEKWIRPYSMGAEFIKNIPRYCLWLEGISPNELKSMPSIKNRVEDCRLWRENATKTGDAYKLKDIPHLFRPCKQFKDTSYIAIPLVSSERRNYVPMGYIYNGMIPGNNLFSIFNSDLSCFGILTSSVHMAWMRAVGGRLKSDYRYSKDIVYNNFIWPDVSDIQKTNISQTAQAILDARALYTDSSLADLYDPLIMPIELRKAHQANDRAVIAAYGWAKDITEEEIVKNLMQMYAKKVAELEAK